MNYFDYVVKTVESGLNDELDATEQVNRPFRIYPDIGDYIPSKRNINDVMGKRYGVASVTASDISPNSSLKFAELTVLFELVINVDGMEVVELDTGESGYKEVINTREIIQEFISKYQGKSYKYVDGAETYSITGTFECPQTGGFAITTSDLGKIVPIRFVANYIFIQNAVNSADITYSIRYLGKLYELYTIQASETMVTTTEGQTHVNNSVVKSTIQECKWGLEIATVVVDNPLFYELYDDMINGISQGGYELVKTIKFNDSKTITTTKKVLITNISMSVQPPNTVGMNLTMIEADELGG